MKPSRHPGGPAPGRSGGRLHDLLFWIGRAGPAAFWMAIILWLSSDRGSGQSTGYWLELVLDTLIPGVTTALGEPRLHALNVAVRKIGHLLAYGLLAALDARFLLAFRGIHRRTVRAGAWSMAVAWAVLDEWLQSASPSRTGTPWDVALDGVGAVLGLAILEWRQRLNTRAN